MALNRKIDALVVGAGPVGLVAALTLLRAGERSVEIIDEADRRTGMSYALALHPEALEVLDGLGLLGQVSARANRLDRIALYDGAARRAELVLGELERQHPYVLALPQGDLEEILIAALAARGVEVRWRHRLSRVETRAEGSAHCTIDRIDSASSGYAVAHGGGVVGKSFEREVPCVLGADGHASLVRRQLGIERQTTGLRGTVAVFELDREPAPADLLGIDPRHELRITFAHGLRSIWWPLPGERSRLGFELPADAVDVEPRHKSRLPSIVPWLAQELDARRLRELVAERLPWHRTPSGRLMWSAAVRFERAQAVAFGRDQVWLAGDAAHLAFPFGVHSMNAGIEEAEDLATRCERILDGTDPAASLQIYGRDQLAAWESRLASWDDAGPAIGVNADTWLAANAQRIAEALPLAPGDAVRLLAAAATSALPAGRA